MGKSLLILLIDDHALLREGLRAVINTHFPQATFTEAASLNEATARVTQAPDLILLDVELPGLSGLAGLPLLQARWPQSVLLMLSSHTDDATQHAALAQGAAGYISKAEPLESIVAKVEKLLGNSTQANQQTLASTLPQQSLTPRQAEVLDLLCMGLSNKLIARRLGVSEFTVRGHVQSVLSLLNVSSRTEAAFAARQRGLVR